MKKCKKQKGTRCSKQPPNAPPWSILDKRCTGCDKIRKDKK